MSVTDPRHTLSNDCDALRSHHRLLDSNALRAKSLSPRRVVVVVEKKQRRGVVFFVEKRLASLLCFATNENAFVNQNRLLQTSRIRNGIIFDPESRVTTFCSSHRVKRSVCDGRRTDGRTDGVKKESTPTLENRKRERERSAILLLPRKRWSVSS